MQCFALSWLFRVILFFTFFYSHSLHPFSHCLLLSLWKYLFFFFFFFLTLCSCSYGSSPGATCLPIRLVQNILIGALSHIALTLLFSVLFSDCLYENTSFLLLVSCWEPFAGSSRTRKQKTVCLDQHTFCFLISLFHVFCSFPISYLKYLVSSFSKLSSYMNEGCFQDCHLWLWIWTILF